MEDNDFLNQTFETEKKPEPPKAQDPKEIAATFALKELLGVQKNGKTDPRKNANLAGFIAILGGCVGCHDFIFGNPKKGIVKAILGLTGVFIIISIFWSTIDLYNIGCGTYKARTGIPMAAAPWCKKAAFLEAVMAIVLITTAAYNIALFFLAKP